MQQCGRKGASSRPLGAHDSRSQRHSTTPPSPLRQRRSFLGGAGWGSHCKQYAGVCSSTPINRWQQSLHDPAPADDCSRLPALPQQQQQQQQQQQLWTWFKLKPFAGMLLLAAAVGLADSGRHSAALASQWPLATDASSSSSSSSSSWNSSRDALLLGGSSGSGSGTSSSSFSAPVSSSVASAAPQAFPGSSAAAGSSSSSAPAMSPAAAAGSSDDSLMPFERACVVLYAATCPSVVNISHVRAMQNFYTLDVHRMAVGQGSGFLWDTNGHIVTNYHVIKGAAEVKVTLHDHSSCTARVVGYDAPKDIAVLKLALPRTRLEALKPVTLGSSSSLRVGQAVFAVGNPFGLDHTMTSGIVSGLGRELSTGLSAIKGIIQTDAAINPGNSGGVLLNSRGAVVGVNLGILDPSGKGCFSGVGFAIPIDTVRGLVDQILTYGRVRRPTLGISIAPEQVLAQLGTEGVLVLEVPAGTPAAAAGLRPTYRDVFGEIILGDIIVGLDTRPIRSTAELITALDERRPGDKARCDVLRDGKRLSMTVTLGERGMYCEE